MAAVLLSGHTHYRYIIQLAVATVCMSAKVQSQSSRITFSVYLTRVIRNSNLSAKQCDVAAQIVPVCMTQLACVPLHLLALDLYNRR